MRHYHLPPPKKKKKPKQKTKKEKKKNSNHKNHNSKTNNLYEIKMFFLFSDERPSVYSLDVFPLI